MRLACHASVLASGVGFLILCYAAFTESPRSLIELLLILGVPFALVTLLRRAINLKRPYEVYVFYEIPPKDKVGRSFPSRHAYSSFVISVTAMFFDPIAGVLLLIFSLAICVFRVLLGIHFIRDVVCGALIGTLSSLIGMLIFSPF